MIKRRVSSMSAAILAIGVVSRIIGASDAISEQARQTMIDMQVTVAVLNAYVMETDSPLVAATAPAPLASAVGDMPRLYRSRLVLRDAWGNRLLFFGDASSFMLASVGPDGELDEPIEEMSEKYRYVSPLPDGDDVVLMNNGRFVKRPMTEREEALTRQRITMTDMRSIGTSIEEYAIDHNIYPEATGGLVTLDAIRSLLEPVYIRTLPLSDAWGEPFLVWSTGNGYMVVSKGSDRLLDTAYDRATEPESSYGAGGEFSDPETDVIFVNGQFVQWPEKTQQ